ncbi:inactive tyrosine-protein kinase transmembrane receptor ROR1-like isoform X2 [Anguilla anguilla]|nr:inactive tyrosine-protein kinase transmembrane receptor ROR1-like isoform X2 [Anguilla anguilla]
MEELGECAFGRVYRGHLYLPGMEQAQLVAIKTLKNPSSPQMWGEFQQEVSLLAELHHHNVASLLGVVTQDMPVCMLLEFLSQGDLRQFLISRSPHSDVGGCGRLPLRPQQAPAAGPLYVPGTHRLRHLHHRLRHLGVRRGAVGDLQLRPVASAARRWWTWYGLMVECWQEGLAQRPRFRDFHSHLT